MRRTKKKKPRITKKLPSYFGEGDVVKYTPPHAKGEPNHMDIEEGEVSSTNNRFVFVKYYIKGTKAAKLIAQATNPEDLELIRKKTKPLNTDWLADIYPKGPAWTGD